MQECYGQSKVFILLNTNLDVIELSLNIQYATKLALTIISFRKAIVYMCLWNTIRLEKNVSSYSNWPPIRY